MSAQFSSLDSIIKQAIRKSGLLMYEMDLAEAEQSIRLKIIERYHEPEMVPRGLIYRFAYCRAIDIRRKLHRARSGKYERFDAESPGLSEGIANLAEDPAPTPEQQVEVREVLAVLDRVLDEREKEILLRRYRDDETFDAIGDRFGIGRSRAQQLAARALKKARDNL